MKGEREKKRQRERERLTDILKLRETYEEKSASKETNQRNLRRDSFTNQRQPVAHAREGTDESHQL